MMPHSKSNKQQLSGVVTRYKIIKPMNPTLVYVEIKAEAEKIVRCIIARQALTFLMDVAVGDLIQIYGHYNNRQQFVIERYTSNQIQANRSAVDHPPHLRYPHRKEDE